MDNLIDKAKILRLLDEADDIVSALYRQGANKDYKCKSLHEKLKAVETELQNIRQNDDYALMHELINREQAGKNICKYCASEAYCKEDDCMVYQGLRDTPTIQIEPEVLHGRWIPTEYDSYADGAPVWDKWECSECSHEHSGDENTLTAFCPDCGTRMDADEIVEIEAEPSASPQRREVSETKKDVKKMTNGDRIRKELRNMTDKELAINLEAFICHKVKRCRAEDITCTECALKWLKQEVSEDADD